MTWKKRKSVWDFATSAATATGNSLVPRFFLGDDKYSKSIYMRCMYMRNLESILQLYKYPSPRMYNDMHRDVFQGQNHIPPVVSYANLSNNVGDSDKDQNDDTMSNLTGMADPGI